MAVSHSASTLLPIARRAVLAILTASVMLFAAAERAAANAPPAEAYVQANVQVGLSILNNHSAPTEERRVKFEQFILGLTDMKRIANFTLGQYRRTATPEEQAAFAAAFQGYAVAVYQSYFDRYSGQTLKVTGSQVRAPGDIIVTTHLLDPKDRSGQQPLEVDFRVVNDGNKFVVIDFSVAGIWLALEERDQFSSFLGQNNGNISTLISHLKGLARTYK